MNVLETACTRTGKMAHLRDPVDSGLALCGVGLNGRIPRGEPCESCAHSASVHGYPIPVTWRVGRIRRCQACEREIDWNRRYPLCDPCEGAARGWAKAVR